MSKRRRVLKVEETSMLLLQQLEHMETSSSDDDDCHIYASKFAELFARRLMYQKYKTTFGRLYAVNKASMREVAVLFDMAEATQFAATQRVLGFLSAIAPDIIHFALNNEALARDFQEDSPE
ncbi:hypothetical protein HPB50_014635 [Hyalomma asiaticum]|uniref:Uncharacterized protein n=1 Tax=Hyalomma asiaticum TaxID=266040 RepID=A0ACB7RPI0_HYAAI|nr:hypothetical protein HPB50_014635 [Hyalomma asiaticum]